MTRRTATADTVPISAATTLAQLPKINLLPPHMVVQRRLRRLQGGCGLAIASVLLMVLVLKAVAGGQQQAEQRRYDAAQAQSAALKRQVAGFAGVTATYAAVDRDRTLLQSALSQEVRYSRLLAAMSTHVPPSVQVTTLSYSQGNAGAAAVSVPGSALAALVGAGPAAIGTVTIGGLTASLDDVATWLESLAAQTGLSNPVLTTSTKMDENGASVVTFSSSAVLANTALSNRYSGPDGGLK